MGDETFPLTDQLNDVDVQSHAYLSHLDKVKTALSSFVFAHEGLWVLETRSNLALADPCGLPILTEQFDKVHVLR